MESIPLPPLARVCDGCFQEPESQPMLRCSVCKNQFFCVYLHFSLSRAEFLRTQNYLQSQKCQSEDWKSHKYHCSPLTPTEFGCDEEELTTQMVALTRALQSWQEAFNIYKKERPDKKADRVRIAQFPESAQLLCMS